MSTLTVRLKKRPDASARSGSQRASSVPAEAMRVELLERSFTPGL